MSFEVSADEYLQFMGKYSEQLASRFIEFADVRPGHRVVDVGAGPGALTAQLVDRVGTRGVIAIDPSRSFVHALRARLPEVDVRIGSAEHLPFPDAQFDASLAQLVVHFMADPSAGIAEMARVTRPGGVVAACVWAQGRGPVSDFAAVVREFDPAGSAGIEPENDQGGREGQLVALCTAAGLTDVVGAELTVQREFADFQAWWSPLLLRVGPAGAYVAQLDEPRRAELRELCAARFPDGPFTITATAWAASGRAR